MGKNKIQKNFFTSCFERKLQCAIFVFPWLSNRIERKLERGFLERKRMKKIM